MFGYGFGPGYDVDLPPQEFAPPGIDAGQLAMLRDNDFGRNLAERQQTLNWAAGPVRPVIVVQGPGTYGYRRRGPGLGYVVGTGLGYVCAGIRWLWMALGN